MFKDVQFRAEDLKKFLENVPNDAVLSIGGEVIQGVELVPGRIQEGYYNPRFTETPKGREKAVVFTRFSELSTGEVVLLKI